MEAADLTPPTLRPSTFAGATAVVAAFSTRAGGVSHPPYDTLNLGISTDDADAHVWANRRRLFSSLGFAPERAAVAGQVHGNDVRHVTEGGIYKGFDGLVTATPGVLLCITAADCAAVLLADPEAGVVGACHSGWRGTVAYISEHTVAAMEALGAEPGRLRAYIAPCIGPERFEVGEEVAEQFDDAFVVRRDAWPRPHIDLKAAIAAQLRAAGVPEAAIETSPRCTHTETDTFFSHRAEGGTTGRMMGVIGLRPDAA